MARSISDFGPYFMVEITDADGYQLIDRVDKATTPDWLDIAYDYMAQGYPVVKTTFIASPFPNLINIVSGGDVQAVTYNPPPSEVTYATSEDYYASESWMAAVEANDALQAATQAVTAIANEIEQSGMSEELNEALNTAGNAQHSALDAYQDVERAVSVEQAQIAAQTAQLSAQVALQAASSVVDPRLLLSPANGGVPQPQPQPQPADTPMPLILALAGLWAAFRG